MTNSKAIKLIRNAKTFNFNLANRIMAWLSTGGHSVKWGLEVDKTEQLGSVATKEETDYVVEPCDILSLKDVGDVHYFHYHSLFTLTYDGETVRIPAPMLTQETWDKVLRRVKTVSFREYGSDDEDGQFDSDLWNEEIVVWAYSLNVNFFLHNEWEGYEKIMPNPWNPMAAPAEILDKLYV